VIRQPVIIFRRMRATDRLEADIRKRLDRLARYYPSIVGARVVVEPALRRRRDGNPFRVLIDLSVPSGAVVISHEASLRPGLRALEVAKTRKKDEPDAALKDAGLAIREAFDAARRRLQDFARRQRGA
jgi:hypothetical protein